MTIMSKLYVLAALQGIDPKIRNPETIKRIVIATMTGKITALIIIMVATIIIIIVADVTDTVVT